MNILGINAQFDATGSPVDDGGSALLCDGKIAYAVAEERICCRKYAGGFEYSMRDVLDAAGVTIKDIDYIYLSFYAHPLIPDRSTVEVFADNLGCAKEKLRIVPSHHLSHACAAYFLSPFDEALIVVADHEGSLLYPKDASKKGVSSNFCERHSYFYARGSGIALIGRDLCRPGETGFGKAYSKFTRYIGLGGYHDAGKTMGLSAYGNPIDGLNGQDLWYLDDDGKLHSNLHDSHNTEKDLSRWFTKIGFIEPKLDRVFSFEDTIRRDLAYYVQSQLQKWGVRKLEALRDLTGLGKFCLSGGVALNSLLNAAIEEELGAPLFVPPYPSDPGQALGNCIYGYLDQMGNFQRPHIDRHDFGEFVYLGREYSLKEQEAALKLISADANIALSRPEDIHLVAAQCIAAGNIIGWFQGRSEYGARALGNRSILADPRSSAIRDRVNHLKCREQFRPLAPAVLAEFVPQYFEDSDSLLHPYMLRTARAKSAKATEIAGVVHVDGTARLQSVCSNDNASLYRLISAFYARTGVPMLTNTSFNRAGNPIVEMPIDAVRAFCDMELDALAIGPFFLEKRSPHAKTRRQKLHTGSGVRENI